VLRVACGKVSGAKLVTVLLCGYYFIFWAVYSMIITRVTQPVKKKSKGSKNVDVYKYVDYKKREVKDAEVLDYIKKLVIPPAYRDVKIFYQKAGEPKILYQGFVSKNRLQRIYSETWRVKAVRKKFCELRNLAEQIQKITAEVKKQMTSERLTKKKCIAMIIRIVMVCYFRIGNKRYQELYGSFGAMNVQKRHIKFKKDKGLEYMYIEFSGKKAVINTCDVFDKTLIKEVKELLKFRDDDEMVFQYLDHGIKVPVRAIDINFWLKTFDSSITSKDFRTYDANILLIIYLRSKRNPVKQSLVSRKKTVVAALKEISGKIHNTPAVLKKNYTQGGMVNMYVDEPVRFNRYFVNDKTPRQAFLCYLRDYCKGFDSGK
jgi:DNA topoisomerase-1